MLFVSVIIPVKSDAAGLSRTLASLPQVNDLEIIVIDGGGDRETRQVIERRADRISYWESGQDTGIANAMNRGVARAKGEFVAILNAGDVWLPHTLRLVANAVAQTPQVEIVHGALQFQDTNGSTHVIFPRMERMQRRMWMFHPTMFVRRDTYARIGEYNEQYKLAMDSEWCHRAMRDGAQFKALPQVLATMALGGRSDVSYIAALAEYRRSVITHGLTSAWQASWWFVYFSLGKTLRRLLSLR